MTWGAADQSTRVASTPRVSRTARRKHASSTAFVSVRVPSMSNTARRAIVFCGGITPTVQPNQTSARSAHSIDRLSAATVCSAARGRLSTPQSLAEKLSTARPPVSRAALVMRDREYAHRTVGRDTVDQRKREPAEQPSTPPSAHRCTCFRPLGSQRDNAPKFRDDSLPSCSTRSP